MLSARGRRNLSCPLRPQFSDPPAQPEDSATVKIYQQLMASLFAMIFQGLAFALILVAGWQFAGAWREGSEEVLSVVVSGINTLVISLAMYELGVGVGKEYDPDHSPDNVYQTVRRTISRFVGTVCSALVLEGLIMAIKYSQLDLAGNLVYPVALLLAAAVLLIALGVFLRLTAPPSVQSELH